MRVRKAFPFLLVVCDYVFPPADNLTPRVSDFAIRAHHLVDRLNIAVVVRFEKPLRYVSGVCHVAASLCCMIAKVATYMHLGLTCGTSQCVPSRLAHPQGDFDSVC